MKRSLIALLAILATSCPASRTIPQISYAELLKEPDRYLSSEIVLQIPEHRYQIVGAEVHVYTGRPDTLPVIVCRGHAPLKNTRPLMLLGTVVAIDRDGIDRGMDHRECVRVGNCRPVVDGRLSRE